MHPIVTLESDKATMEIPTTEAGVVKEIKVKVGDKVSTGTVLITLKQAAHAAKAEAKPVKAPEKKQAKPAKAEKTVKPEAAQPETEATRMNQSRSGNTSVNRHSAIYE